MQVSKESDAISALLGEELPILLQQSGVRLCATKWLNFVGKRTNSRLYRDNLHGAALDVGTAATKCAMQSERLLKLQFKLDEIIAGEDAALIRQRRSTILRIQDLEHQADLLLRKADRLQKLLKWIRPEGSEYRKGGGGGGSELQQLLPLMTEEHESESHIARTPSLSRSDSAFPELDISVLGKLRTHGWLMKKVRRSNWSIIV
jgi:hypothetical protein